MNTLDIIVISIVALSGLFAFMRGFVREVLSIGAWVGAFILAYYAFTPVQPFTRQLISTAWLADTVTAAVLFVVGLLIFSVIVGVLSDRVRASGLGPLDRALGLVFGVARGVFFLCIAYLVASRLLPTDSWPSWMLEARTRPLVAAGASALQNLIPHSMLDQGNKALGQASQAVNNAADLASPNGLGITPLTPEAREAAASLADNAAVALRAKPDPADNLRQAPKAKETPPQSGYDTEQSREMARAIQQSLGSGQK